MTILIFSCRDARKTVFSLVFLCFAFVLGCSKAKAKQRKTKENTVFRAFRQEKIKIIIFAAVVFFICY